MNSDDIFNKPNAFFALGSAITLAVLPAFEAHWIIWFLICTFLVLWFFVLIAQSNGETRRALIGTLRDVEFKHLYIRMVSPLLARFWYKLCDPAPQRYGMGATFRAALTWKLFDRALLIAVAYPICLLVGLWLFAGVDGTVGAAIVLPAAAFIPDRLLVLVVGTILMAGLVLARSATDWRLPFVSALAFGLAVIAAVRLSEAFTIESAFAIDVAAGGLAAGIFVVAGTTAGMFAGAFAISGAIGLAISIPIASVFTDTHIGRLAITTAFPIAFAGASEFFLIRTGPQRARITLTIVLPVIWFFVLATLPWAEIPKQVSAVFVLFGVFPLVNAVVDVVSYATTLTLMRLGLRRWHPFLCGTLDLGIAVFLFLILGIILAVVLTAMNAVAGVPLVDLGAVFTGVRDDPGRYTWLYLMLFSTILPTALHAFLALILGAQTLMLRILRVPLANLAETAPKALFAPVTVPPLIAGLALVPIAFLTLIAWLSQLYWWPGMQGFFVWYHDRLLLMTYHWIDVI